MTDPLTRAADPEPGRYVATTPPSSADRATPTIWRRYGLVVASFFLGIVSFVIAVAGFAAGIGTFVVWLGLPILVGTLLALRPMAQAERNLVEHATCRPLPPHHYRQPKSGGIRGLLERLADPQSWRDLLHAVVMFPIRVTTFVVAVVWGVGGLGSALYATWAWSLPESDSPDDRNGLVELVTGVDWYWAEVAFNTAVGLLMLLTLPWVLRGLAGLHRVMARALLVNENAALRARATALESSRRAAVHAEASTLRRVERDIHDGPQQRLVRLNMDLETASRRLATDPERAQPLLAEALEQSREALAELRALSRGIAPPILADRGLAAALAASAARCPVPVTLDVDQSLDQGRRLPPAVENTAYFVVTEALTNVAKHAAASQVDVVVSSDGHRLLVQVRDDGVGGAHLGKGHGLSGLADRLIGVEGALDVHSPTGGPTVLTADIPLAGVGEDR